MGFTFAVVVALSLSVAQPPSLLSVLARAGDSAAAFHRDFRQLVAVASSRAVDFSRMNVEVTYRPDPTLDVFVPLEMKEIFSREVQTAGGGPVLDGLAATHYVSDRLSCVAIYANVRRVVTLEPRDVVSGR